NPFCNKTSSKALSVAEAVDAKLLVKATARQSERKRVNVDGILEILRADLVVYISLLSLLRSSVSFVTAALQFCELNIADL
ncbi:MAG: hypothetical protein VW664_09045, partial [Halieaceae bacterium]